MKNLKVLRLVCALAVVFSHSFSVVSGNPLDEPLEVSTGYSLGDYAVLVFFVVSGIVIPLSLARSQTLLRFWQRRALRIFPALVVCVLTTVFLLGPVVSTRSLTDYFDNPQVFVYAVGTLSTLSTGLGLPGVFETVPDRGQINVPLWTLKYELFAYAVATVVFLVTRMKVLPASLLACGLLFVDGWMRSAVIEFDPRFLNLTIFLFAFFCGAVGLALFQKAVVAALCAALCAVVAGLLLGTSFWLGAVVVVLALATLALSHAPPIPVFSAPRFGDYSYGLYIFAFPAQQFVVQTMPGITPIPHFFVTLLITLPIAAGSWHLLESRAIGFGKRL